MPDPARSVNSSRLPESPASGGCRIERAERCRGWSAGAGREHGRRLGGRLERGDAHLSMTINSHDLGKRILLRPYPWVHRRRGCGSCAKLLIEMSLEQRSRTRRSYIEVHRATSFEDGEAWDLDSWQRRKPEQRLGDPAGRWETPFSPTS